MRVVIHANGVPWQREYLGRFRSGFMKHGFTVKHSREDRLCDTDAVHVIFANNSWKNTHTQALREGVPLLAIGRCFFGSRFDMVAIGWGGFNGAADFCVSNTMPPDRWEKHGGRIPTPAWHGTTKPVLVCGEFRPMGGWYRRTAEALAGVDVWWRAHPFRASEPPPVKGWKTAPHYGQDQLYRLLRQVRACVTYDSIAGCDTVLAGVPSIAYGKDSMARSVSWSSWDKFPKTRDEFFDQAELLPFHQWAYKLAYCQWDHDEIANGDFITHLFRDGCYPPVGGQR